MIIIIFQSICYLLHKDSYFLYAVISKTAEVQQIFLLLFF